MMSPSTMDTTGTTVTTDTSTGVRTDSTAH
jgi:hypothetical protein